MEKFTTPEGDVHLVRPASSRDIVVEQPTAAQVQLLEALDGRTPLAELERRFGEREVGETIAQFQELEVIEDAADDELVPAPERERFDRQLRCFSDSPGAELTPSECQARLREAKVAVLGVGGLGGSSALALASCGVGELWLVDGDRVELSNLNRQTLYTVDDVGQLKVEAAKRALRSFYPEMRVTATARRLGGEAEVADFVAGADVVVDSADWPAFEFERWCNAACFAAGIPFITMSHFSWVARVGPLFVPGRTGCYSCQEIAYRREYPLLDTATTTPVGSSEAATLGPACGLIGNHVAMEVMHLLTGLAEPATLGASLNYDLRTMEMRREEIVPEPDCPVCSELEHEERLGLEAAASR
ncbi:MAG TPA: TOMM precursor leader peptide-binding protein [Solirubrobacterales bacterium]|nr:TOMM precursor leader peptide-binding protein [Solirubrobacterales bacterium]